VRVSSPEVDPAAAAAYIVELSHRVQVLERALCEIRDDADDLAAAMDIVDRVLPGTPATPWSER
jgi:hypothetical protein